MSEKIPQHILERTALKPRNLMKNLSYSNENNVINLVEELILRPQIHEPVLRGWLGLDDVLSSQDCDEIENKAIMKDREKRMQNWEKRTKEAQIKDRFNSPLINNAFYLNLSNYNFCQVRFFPKNENIYSFSMDSQDFDNHSYIQTPVLSPDWKKEIGAHIFKEFDYLLVRKGFVNAYALLRLPKEALVHAGQKIIEKEDKHHERISKLYDAIRLGK